MPLKKMVEYNSPLLNISEDEEILGFKYVFQTLLTKDTVNERIRAPLAFWDRSETFIDNDLHHVITRLDEYYGDSE